jgi:nicotinate-nucleotide pyrophosphorylase (carboxylating)
MTLEPIPADILATSVRRALEEDAAFEDVTTLNTVASSLDGVGTFLAKSAGVVAGWDAVREVFRQLDPSIVVDVTLPDGSHFERGKILGTVRGPVRGLLQGERVALNFMQRMSGTATLAATFVKACTGTRAVILDTRKTTPGMRAFEKYAVRAGGATNHRGDLREMAMIKDNHREAIAREGLTLRQAVERIRTAGKVPVEIEIDSLDDLERALDAAPEWILLDNMAAPLMAEAVRRTAGRAKLEASGGVNLETVSAIARAGVDAISIGALTHSAPALDISLDLQF